MEPGTVKPRSKNPHPSFSAYHPGMSDQNAAVPMAPDGEERFAAITKALRSRLDELVNAPPVRRGIGAPIPKVPGVYLFTKDGVATYVGQTRNLRQRLAQHAGATSRENQASFAFNLAKKEALEAGIDVDRRRRELAADPDFSDRFAKARKRVAAMDIRFIELDDPELRTVFEVYAAVMLGTGEHNKFETH
ncbi:MAG TPA: hypothetical protein DIT48_08430 [Actinobacteria bacterium]|nr:hypothetical protein [Actinomycetota bacterium]